jgi:hypothetical protein
MVCKSAKGISGDAEVLNIPHFLCDLLMQVEELYQQPPDLFFI